MKKCILIFLLLSTHFLTTQAQSKFQKFEFTDSQNLTLPYRILYPIDFDSTKSYPVVLFLHGAGERGNDNEKQLNFIAPLFEESENQKTYPAIVVAPQCPLNYYWIFNNAAPQKWDRITYAKNEEISLPLYNVQSYLKTLLQKKYVNKKKVYIIGLSMGGMATLDMVIRNPKVFAAAIPICGGVNIDRLKKCEKTTAFRIYHSSDDNIVPVENSRKITAELQRLKIPVEYKEYTNAGHGSWVPAFAEKDFMSWLFSQSKK